MLLAFYVPPETDDLYRYYQLFDISKELSAKDFWSSQFGVTDELYNYLLNDYMKNSKVFMVILFILSRSGIKQLLPVTFALLAYIPIILVVCDIGKENNYSKQAMCICFNIILACVDVRFLTLLRNMSAYAMFSGLLYCDLIKNKNRIFCFIGYLLLCELHMSCVVLLGIRLILLITNKHFRFVIIATMISVFAFTRQLATILTTYFSGIPYLTRLAQRMLDYNIGRTNYNYHGAIFFVGSLFVCLVCYLLIKNRESVKKSLELYSRMYIYLFAYTIGSIAQYDILTRNCELVVILTLPYMMSIANDIHINRTAVYIHNNDNSSAAYNVGLACLLLALVVFSYTFYGAFSYIPLQQGLTIL